MLPCPSLVSLLFTYYQPTEDTGVRRPISYVNFQKRICSQKRYWYSDSLLLNIQPQGGTTRNVKNKGQFLTKS